MPCLLCRADTASEVLYGSSIGEAGMRITTEILIVGGGMVGLSLAHQLSKREIAKEITIVDKEVRLGMHSSGRNSGVLHAGIYYEPNSLKARICVKGKKRLEEWVTSRGLEINKCGKIIVVQKKDLDEQLDRLNYRATQNGASTQFITKGELASLEPNVATNSDRALWSPETAVVDPRQVLRSIEEEVKASNVKIRYNSEVIEIDSVSRKAILIDGTQICYQHLVNCAGINADLIARHFGVGSGYTLMPFKGSYWQISDKVDLGIRHNIYPVPDLSVPFLGIHFTPSSTGSSVSIGPTATLALGRSCYGPIEEIDVGLTLKNVSILLRQYISNSGGFRRYAQEQALLGLDRFMIREVQRIVPGLTLDNIKPSEKVGIRPQVFDLKNKRLVDDFVCERGLHSTHIINAISPAFTASFELADYIVNEYIS